METASVKCEKCGYDVKVTHGRLMNERVWRFKDIATFICPQCFEADVKEVMVGKKDLIRILKDHPLPPSGMDTAEILLLLIRSLEETSNSSYCKKCKVSKLKFRKRHIEDKKCPICDSKVDYSITILAD